MVDRSQIDRVWLNVDEVVQRTGVSKTEIYEALRDHKLVGHQRSKNSKWRMHIDDVDSWMRGQRSPSLRSA